ncbi:non-reducing polyketide synthase spyA [Aspergillus lucknowensis]|uniref:Polyketide synthase n=1 Tax=Aspergillus lucknowensis TaxID=176173 RepID=A0ABR4LVP5_9EURO
MPSSAPSMIICGSQTTPPTSEVLGQLASYLKESPDLAPLREAIIALPEAWAILKVADPHLQGLSDGPVIRLRDCLAPPVESHRDVNGGSIVPETLANSLLAPLTVIVHIVQYMHYLDSLDIDNKDAHIHIRGSSVSATQDAETVSKFQGLCIGSLSAAVLECSTTKRALGQNAAAAVKLAMCIGAHIDFERLANPRSNMVCFIVRFGESNRREDVEASLSRYSEAYISVELDKNTVTVTAPESDMPSLRRELNSAGVRVADIPVRGRYHSRKNGPILQRILRLCSSTSSPFCVPWEAEKLEGCLQSILVEPAHWFSDISKAVNSLASASQSSMTTLELGLVSCFPPSLSADPYHHVIRGSLPDNDSYSYPETSIAVIGAACKYPGADSLDQFWNLISTGQVTFGQAPPGRFKETVTGNFLFDADRFDCGLFSVSPREATYMDPQQRIALQVAYQAVGSSGYFGSPKPNRDVGCYVGVGSSDYEHKVNSNMSTAYSFTGTSRAFVSGRISHFFKWTGPSITVDTACSSSGTAIHQACNGLAMGDCSVALAGGVHIMSSAPANRHIAAAGMTNSSGACRPFDADAAGYSRSEGCAFVVLKRLSAAVADGDNILGVIAGTATNQSDGSDSITVPVMQSQASLFRRALSRAAMDASDISYVEAHGTGTRRGDPVEYQSAREVFAGGQKVHVGSVKANIGHTESASGVAAVLKVLMMLRYRRIPGQANFASLNPKIPLQEHGNQLVIDTQMQQWDRGFRAACVNNYGAAGHNAAIVICQPPRRKALFSDASQSLQRYPFLICAQSQNSLKRYCIALADYLEATSFSLAEAACLVARQQDRSLRYRIVFDAASIPELQSLLRGHAHSAKEVSLSVPANRQARPTVLVFGGQTGSAIYFSKAVYDTSYYLRQHVDKCDALVRDMGLPSLFPRIFSRDPIDDVVILHACLFSIQYACASAWLDAGVSVRRVIGHSFGQLTAMCIAGVITLDEALRLVIGRARLIRDCWGDEKGSMLSVSIDRTGAETLAQSEPGIEVACYNAPNSHVLVGCEKAITDLQARISSLSLPFRRLRTSHGFHSQFVEPLMAEYLDLARTISFRAPVIPIETCSDTTSWQTFTAKLVAEHSRTPVYFCDAVRRIERDLGPCTWLEAGSGSGAVVLAKQSLNGESNSLCHLQLGSSNGINPLESVVTATIELWRQGSPVQGWMYHPTARVDSSNLVCLPGYQFDTSSHWLPSAGPDSSIHLPQKNSLLEGAKLISMACLSHPEPHVCCFDINQEDESLARVLRGREVLGEPLWPLTLYMSVVADAAALLTPGIPPSSLRLRLAALKIRAPLGARRVDGLRLRMKQTEMRTWEFSLESDFAEHAIGTVIVDDQRSHAVNYTEYANLPEAHPTTMFSVPGCIAYKLLEKVAGYDPAYRGIESIRMNNRDAIARVHMPSEAAKYSGRTSYNPILLDQFLAIAEIHALSMEDCNRSDVFACSGFSEAIIRTSAVETNRNWLVYTRQSSRHGREILYDVFVHETSEDGGKDRFVLAVLGARFMRTSTRALTRIVERANAAPVSPEKTNSSPRISLPEDGSANARSVTVNLLQQFASCLPQQILPDTVLADLGMDSLAMMELEARIKTVFQLNVPCLVERDSTVHTLCDRIAAAQAARGLSASISPSLVPTSELGSGTGSPSSESDNETQATELSLSPDVLTMEKVTRLVATHLCNGGQVLPSSKLHSLGLDSLAIMELQSDIYANFGASINLALLADNTTVGDLHALIGASTV